MFRLVVGGPNWEELFLMAFFLIETFILDRGQNISKLKSKLQRTYALVSRELLLSAEKLSIEAYVNSGDPKFVSRVVMKNCNIYSMYSPMYVCTCEHRACMLHRLLL